ncbi:acyltransferase family protein [Flavobacterium franklandianum]|uniref:acyltransferase n=1 Tax=Flavobacterium franklandianum TaxID=2594430 RepID=UPI00117ABC9F|nr:acyltransferase family protein [Flavobacterium franklandianum]TRX27811.1 acyltransferase family protein [Flavobacterium franklandianum]
MKSSSFVNQERIVWADVLRFVAMFMVISVHCTDPFNISPAARLNPEYNFWGTIYGSILRPCVPLFVMLTGMLLLPVKQEIGLFYKKKLTRVVFPFLIWSVLYNLFPWFTGVMGYDSSIITKFFVYAGDAPSQAFKDSLHNIIMIPFTFTAFCTHMWYIYLLIGLYLFMPIFSAWVREATDKQKRMYLYFWGVTLFLPYIHEYVSNYIFGACPWNGRFDLFYYFAGFNGYLLLGHYLSNGNSWSVLKTLFISAFLFAIGYFVTYVGFGNRVADPKSTEEQIELFFLYCTPNVFLMTIAVFMISQKIKIDSPFWINIFANLTKCGFGIYMVHYFLVGPSFMIIDLLHIPIPIQIPVAAGMTFGFAWLFTVFIYKLLPTKAKWIMG